MHPLDTAAFGVRAAAGAAAAGVGWLIAADAGNAVVRRLAPGVRGRATFGAALGYALLGSAVGLLALAHLLNQVAIGAVVLCVLAVRARSYWKSSSEFLSMVPEMRARFRSSPLWTRCAWVITALGLAIAFCAAALPAVFWDPIAYHLPIVALGLANHTLSFDPGVPQTGFPLLAEAAALPAYVFAGTAGAAMSTLGAGIVLALLSGEIAETLAEGAGPLTTMLVVTSALWLWLAPSFYIDVPFALFAVAAVAVPFLARDDGRAQVAVLSGAFAGAAAATKYPGLFVALVAALIVLVVLPGRMSQLGRFALGFGVIAAGWYARSLTLTGDPIYPFLSSALAFMHRTQQTSSTHQNIVQSLHAASPHFCGGGIGPADLFLLPWWMLADPKRFCGDPGYALRLGLVLVIVATLLIARVRPWVAIASLLTVFWFYTAQQWRFLVDAVALFAIVAAVAAISMRDRARTIVIGLLVALSFLGVLTQLVPWMIADASNSLVPAYRYMTRGESAADYLRKRLESYAASEWLAQHDPTAKVFALDDVRDYYFGTNVAWGNSPYPGGRRLNWTDSAQRRYRGLVGDGFRYMVVNANPAYTHRTTIDVDWRALAGDEHAGVVRKVFEQNDVVVYELQHFR